MKKWVVALLLAMISGSLNAVPTSSIPSDILDYDYGSNGSEVVIYWMQDNGIPYCYGLNLINFPDFIIPEERRTEEPMLEYLKRIVNESITHDLSKSQSTICRNLVSRNTKVWKTQYREKYLDNPLYKYDEFLLGIRLKDGRISRGVICDCVKFKKTIGTRTTEAWCAVSKYGVPLVYGIAVCEKAK